MNGRRRLIGSFNHGSMANAMPQALGVQAAYPDRQVVALSGDGGIAMMLGDLITLQQQRHPVKVVVFNNGALAFVELEMKAAGIVNFATELKNPHFAEVAVALGMHGVRVERPDESLGRGVGRQRDSAEWTSRLASYACGPAARGRIALCRYRKVALATDTPATACARTRPTVGPSGASVHGSVQGPSLRDIQRPAELAPGNNERLLRCWPRRSRTARVHCVNRKG